MKKQRWIVLVVAGTILCLVFYCTLNEIVLGHEIAYRIEAQEMEAISITSVAHFLSHKEHRAGPITLYLKIDSRIKWSSFLEQLPVISDIKIEPWDAAKIETADGLWPESIGGRWQEFLILECTPVAKAEVRMKVVWVASSLGKEGNIYILRKNWGKWNVVKDIGGGAI